MADVINAVSGNKMFQLKQGIKELRERLKVEEDPDVIAGIKKEIMEIRQAFFLSGRDCQAVKKVINYYRKYLF